MLYCYSLKKDTMLKVIFNVEYRDKKTKKKGSYTCNKIVIGITVAEELCKKYNRLGQIGQIEYVYSIIATEMVGFVANYGECIHNVNEA
jgi:hypothetical protein